MLSCGAHTTLYCPTNAHNVKKNKLAAFNYYINKMMIMPISEQAIKQE